MTDTADLAAGAPPASDQHISAAFDLERMLAASRRGDRARARAYWENVRRALLGRPAWEVATMERERGLL